MASKTQKAWIALTELYCILKILLSIPLCTRSAGSDSAGDVCAGNSVAESSLTWRQRTSISLQVAEGIVSVEPKSFSNSRMLKTWSYHRSSETDWWWTRVGVFFFFQIVIRGLHACGLVQELGTCVIGAPQQSSVVISKATIFSLQKSWWQKW